MIEASALHELEAAVQHALRTGDDSALRVLGRGEISVVLGWPSDAPQWACKRLPPFPDRAAADRYVGVLDRYTVELTRRGVDVLATEQHQLVAGDGSVVLYCVQPVLVGDTLAVQIGRDEPDRAAAVLGEVVAAVLDVVDASVGLDAQLSNWAVVDGRLTYFDVTTPLLRRSDGSAELDSEVFLASLPWALRAPVRRWVLPGILERYHQPRTVVLDLAANLVKERLDHLIPAVLTAANPHLERRLTEDEVRRDYRSDARMWALLQALRRADRGWQRHVRRRTYPFLLPGRLAR